MITARLPGPTFIALRNQQDWYGAGTTIKHEHCRLTARGAGPPIAGRPDDEEGEVTSIWWPLALPGAREGFELLCRVLREDGDGDSEGVRLKKHRHRSHLALPLTTSHPTLARDTNPL